MNHTDSAIKIFYTKEYSLFKMIDGNRQLNAPKIRRIISDINKGIDLLRYCPILVIERNGRLEIIDGQHRFYVARKLGSKVWYIVAEQLSLYDIARMNSNTEKWNAKDFINCYAQLGNKNYEQLRAFVDKYPIPVKGGSGNKARFEHGTFENKHADYAIKLMDIISAFSFEKKYSRSFIRAVENVVRAKKISIGELVEKVNKDNSALKYLETEKQYLSGMEDIFNKGKKIRVVIY